MARSRPGGTLVDYLVAAIEPALIIIMVGSLMFFLLDLWYEGQFLDRLRWILFWFVLGIVLITRVSMQIGSSLAMGYGVTLGGAVAVVASVLTGFQPSLLIILGVVWWATHKLTFDCTLLDEDQDAGVGLLQESGLDRLALADSGSPPASAPDDPEAMETSLMPERPWWQLLGRDSDQARRPHPPGVWLIYFALASLPVFGLGQWFVPAVEEDRRGWLFLYFLAYIASAMGLLLATSFLNLRRYLRQRKLKMPGAITATWLSTGAILIAGLTLTAALLPIPGSGSTILRGSAHQESNLRASRTAMLKDSGVQGEGAQSEGRAAAQAKGPPSSTTQPKGSGKTNDPNAAQQTSGKGRGGGKSGPGNGKSGAPRGKSSKGKSGAPGKQGESRQDQAEGQNKTQSGQAEKETDRDQDADQKSSSDQQDASDQNDEKSSQEDQDQNDSTNRTPQLPQLPFQAPSWLRGLIVAAGAIALVVAAIRHGSALLQALRDLLASLFGGLFIEKRQKREKDQAAEVSKPSLPVRPFASFANPFEIGLDQRISPNDLVIYSFEALEAWASEHSLARSPNETPTEFVRRLGHTHSDLRTDSARLAGYFVTIVYGQRVFNKAILPPIREFWQALKG
jgi:Domain of unknown function (DUF4129)